MDSFFPPNTIPPLTTYRRPTVPSPPPLIFINGKPGVGKSAIAQCLSLLLGVGKSVLIDVNQLCSGVGHDNQIAVPNLMSDEVDLDAVADSLVRLLMSPRHDRRHAILPSYAPDSLPGNGFVLALEAAAARAGRAFIPVELLCEPVELRRRAGSLQRQLSLAGSPPNPLRKGTGLATVLLPGLTVDITRMHMPEAALAVLGFTRDVSDGATPGYHSGDSSPASTPTECRDQLWKQFGAP